MTTIATVSPVRQEWTDEEVIQRVLDGDTPSFELLVRRYNQRTYRIIRAVLRDDAEAEDVMQEAYVRAFQHLGEFEGRAAFSTWLGRIAIHEALARMGRSRRYELVDFSAESNSSELRDLRSDPEQEAAKSESRALLEQAILALPAKYRVVIMLRDIEELSTLEAAQTLEISEDAVKVRLHRARALLRRQLYAITGRASASAFQFHASRCDRTAQAVLSRITGWKQDATA